MINFFNSNYINSSSKFKPLKLSSNLINGLSIIAILGISLFSEIVKPANAVVIPDGVKLAKNQVLGYKIGSTPETLDPGINTDWGSQQLEKSIFDTLVRQDYTGKIVGVGASHWTISKNGLVWTFYLRKNATWTDGKPVVASDYIYAWERVLNPATASLGADVFTETNIKNAKAIASGKLPPSDLGVKALSPYILQITLSKPTPWFLQTLTFLNTAPVRKDLIEKYGSAWTRPDHIQTNGPFKLVANRFNDYLLLEKRNDYWDAKNIKITKIKFVVLDNPNASYYGYLTGRFYTTRIPTQFVPLVEKERPNEIIKEPYPATYALILNTNRQQFKDPKVRHAIYLLFDRNFITSKIYRAYYPTTIVTPTILEGAEDLKQDNYALLDKYKNVRIAEARKLLQQAGYTKEHPLTFTWLYTKGHEATKNNIALSRMLEDYSGNLIRINLVNKSKSIYYQDIGKRNFDAVYYIMNPDYYHASTFFRIFLPSSINNYSGWTNPEYTKLYQESEQAPNATVRDEIYQKLNLILQQQDPVVPIMLAQRFILKSPALGGFNGKIPFTYPRDYYIIAGKHVAPSKGLF